jgi:hypothetical protein
MMSHNISTSLRLSLWCAFIQGLQLPCGPLTAARVGVYLAAKYGPDPEVRLAARNPWEEPLTVGSFSPDRQTYHSLDRVAQVLYA